MRRGARSWHTERMIETPRPLDSSHALALDPDDLEDVAELPARSPSVAARLAEYGILPPEHAKLPPRVLAQVEQLFVTWYELEGDDARRAALHYLLPTESQLRAVLLAIVPLYHDRLFFDDATPTKSLIGLALVAHAKWRRWLAETRS